MPISSSERRKILEVVGNIYAEGYAEGVDLVASEYDVRGHVPAAAAEMPKALKLRLDLVEQSMDKYLEAIKNHAEAMSAKGLSGDALMYEVETYTRNVVSRHAETITQTEYAKGRMDGAGKIMDETGAEYEFRFPHFDLETPGHEVCPICDAISEGSPYTPEEAESQGYPDVPHPNCDHGWVIVPKGEVTRTEEFPQGPADVPSHLLED